MARAERPISEPAPASSAVGGTLGATPLAHIFVHARQRGLTGVLRLTPDERAAEALDVSLVNGFVRTATPVVSSAGSDLPIARLVVRAFSFPASTRFSFRPASELEATANARPDLEPLALVWAGLRAHGVEATAKAVLGRLGPTALRLAEDITLDRYGFTAEERRIAERFRTPSRPGLARLEVLVAYVLAITKGLVLAPEAGVTRPDPKRFSTPPVGSVRAPRITGDSRTDFQAAEVALAQHDVERADFLCRASYEENPRQPETMALLGWLRTLRADGHETYAIREATDLLDRAIDLDPGCERAYNYRAQIRRAAGDIAGALEDFRSASRLNPHNVEAAREVRLHDMRAKRAAEDERKSSGLFHRILGKK